MRNRRVSYVDIGARHTTRAPCASRNACGARARVVDGRDEPGAGAHLEQPRVEVGVVAVVRRVHRADARAVLGGGRVVGAHRPLAGQRRGRRRRHVAPAAVLAAEVAVSIRWLQLAGVGLDALIMPEDYRLLSLVALV